MAFSHFLLLQIKIELLKFSGKSHNSGSLFPHSGQFGSFKKA